MEAEKMLSIRTLECADCGLIWDVPIGEKPIHICPVCGGKNVFIPMYDETVDHDILDPHLFS